MTKGASRRRTRWDFLIVVLVVVTCVLIPFQLAFVRRVGLWGSLLVYSIDLVFLWDISLQLRAGRRGSALGLHLAASLPFDMLALFASATLGGIPLVLFLRVLRLLRIIQLLAIFRRWERLSWTNSGYLRITKLVGLAGLFVHWIGCGWFLVAVVEGFPADSWAVIADIQARGTGTQYLRSIYWGFVTTTTVGFGDITPHRNLEYAFTLIVMVVGASMYALIIGNIASLARSLDSAKSSYWGRVEGTAQYLRARQIPEAVADRVHLYYDHLWTRYRGTDAHALLEDLPRPLRLEVLEHLTSELLRSVPLFHHAAGSLRDALLLALVPQVYLAGSTVVREGDVADGIYLVSRGRLRVLADGLTTEEAALEPGESFGELSLLLDERRTAGVVAETDCDLFFLPRSEFQRLRSDFVEFRDVLKAVSSERTEKTQNLILAGVTL